MTTAEILLQIFDLEMRGTRITLERIPADKADYRPHEKSMPMGRLAVHVATLSRFMIAILGTDSLDLATLQWPHLVFESREKLLGDFDALTAEARQILAGATDAQLTQHWKLAWGDKVLADAPRAVLFHTLFLNHLIHHRAQLGVYLRLNDLPVPGLYGPSADEGMG